MTSPARKHAAKFANTAAVLMAAVATELEPNSNTSPLAHYQAALDADLARLKLLKTKPQKIAAKAEMLPTYWPFVEDYLANKHDYPNSIAIEIMVWLIDIGDIEKGLNLAYVLIAQNQHLPPRFASDIPTYLCDNLYDWASAQLTAGADASGLLSGFCEKVVSEGWDISPVPKAKPFVMLAKHLFKAGEFNACIEACNHAETFNENAGVKKLKQDAQKALQE